MSKIDIKYWKTKIENLEYRLLKIQYWKQKQKHKKIKKYIWSSL